MDDEIKYVETCTPHLTGAIFNIIRQGVPFEDACIMNDVLPETGERWLEESESFRRAYRKNMAECRSILLQNIHSGENVSGSKYLLELLFGGQVQKKPVVDDAPEVVLISEDTWDI